MKLLLDTHVFLWWEQQPQRLPPPVLDAIQNTENELFLSVASVWEMQIKHQLGKLELKISLQRLIAEQVETNGLRILPVQLAHTLELGALPSLHKDPFDRVLIAQARCEQLVLVSADQYIRSYPVKTLWAELH